MNLKKAMYDRTSEGRMKNKEELIIEQSDEECLFRAFITFSIFYLFISLIPSPTFKQGLLIIILGILTIRSVLQMVGFFRNKSRVERGYKK